MEVDDLIAAGYQNRREGKSEEALRSFSKAVARSRENALTAALAQSLAGLGQIERDRGNIGSASDHYRESVAILRGLNAPLRFAHTIRHLGDIRREAGDPKEAYPCYTEALAIYRSDPATLPLDLANTLRGYALLLETTGRSSEAAANWQEAQQMYLQAGVQAGVNECDSHLTNTR